MTWDQGWIQQSLFCVVTMACQNIYAVVLPSEGQPWKKLNLSLHRYLQRILTLQDRQDKTNTLHPRVRRMAWEEPYACRRALQLSTACCSLSKRRWQCLVPAAGAQRSTGMWPRFPHRCRCHEGPGESRVGAGGGGCIALQSKHRHNTAPLPIVTVHVKFHGGVLLTPGCKSVTVNVQNKYQTSWWLILAALPGTSPRPPSIRAIQQLLCPHPQHKATAVVTLSAQTGTRWTLKKVILSVTVPYGSLCCWILINLVLGWLGVLITCLPPCKFPGSTGLMQFSLLGGILAWSDLNFFTSTAPLLAWLKGAKGVKTTGRSIERHTHITYLPFQVPNSALQ